jgi:hypothetical protein
MRATFPAYYTLVLINLLLAKARTRRERALWYVLFLLAILEKWWWKSGAAFLTAKHAGIAK